VNGVKKWITNGVFADYFVTAVRTGPKNSGVNGLSLLLVERGDGLETKPIKTSYSASAGTAYVSYDDVLVPVSNLLGKEGEGFKLIMHNFNHERWYIVAGVNRASRLIIEECLKWSKQRMVFGKPLAGAAGDPAKTRQAREPGRRRPGLARGDHVPDATHVAR
jgi:alkylation response protein AidB-like acyl-CoA dehydrogenase